MICMLLKVLPFRWVLLYCHKSRRGADDLRVNDDVLRWAAEVTPSR
jgi:hypothetical protein